MGLAGPGDALPPRAAFETLVEGLEFSLFLELSAFLALGFAELVRGRPVVGSTFSLSATSAGTEVELDGKRPRERTGAGLVVSDVEAGRVLEALGGSWKIVNVGAIGERSGVVGCCVYVVRCGRATWMNRR
jgi:hypothetical protein